MVRRSTVKYDKKSRAKWAHRRTYSEHDSRNTQLTPRPPRAERCDAPGRALMITFIWIGL